MILYLNEEFRLGFSDFKTVLDNQTATGAAAKLKGHAA
jgi:hypothetical protein